MLFPVFKKIGDRYSLEAIYDDHQLLLDDFKSGKYDRTFYHWEPWPVNKPFSEGMV